MAAHGADGAPYPSHPEGGGEEGGGGVLALRQPPAGCPGRAARRQVTVRGCRCDALFGSQLYVVNRGDIGPNTGECSLQITQLFRLNTGKWQKKTML